MEKLTFRCAICGYIYVGEVAPDECPICGATKENFILEAKGHISENQNLDEAMAYTMDPHVKEVLIIGGGIAALSAAEALRETSEDIGITMITNEERLPYYRLNLTKYMSGDSDEASLSIHPQYWYDEKRIKLLKSRVVVDIDRKANEVLLFDGIKVAYDRLIMALGAHPFVPPIEGATKEGVTSIRTLEDIKGLEVRLKPDSKILVIGGGILGLETAGALATKGYKVTVGEGSTYLMPRQLNDIGASYVEKVLAAMDIDILYNFRTKKIKSVDNVLEASTAEGKAYTFDQIVLATGVRPNTYIARKASLEVDKGVVVNNYMQTSDTNIYAAGDVCEHYGICYGLWPVAMYQGKIAALNVLGIKTSFGGVPRSNALKVLNIDLFSIGEVKLQDGGFEAFEIKGSETYLYMVVHDQQLVGAIALGYVSLTYQLKKAVEDKYYFKTGELINAEMLLKAIKDL